MSCTDDTSSGVISLLWGICLLMTTAFRNGSVGLQSKQHPGCFLFPHFLKHQSVFYSMKITMQSDLSLFFKILICSLYFCHTLVIHLHPLCDFPVHLMYVFFLISCHFLVLHPNFIKTRVIIYPKFYILPITFPNFLG